MVSAGVLVENTLYRRIPLISNRIIGWPARHWELQHFFSTRTLLINCLVFLLCFVVSIIVLKIVFRGQLCLLSTLYLVQFVVMHSSQVAPPSRLTRSTITRSGWRKELFPLRPKQEPQTASALEGQDGHVGLLCNLLIKLNSGIVSCFSQIMQFCLHRFQLRLVRHPVKTFSILLVNFVLLGRCSAEHYTLLKPRWHRSRTTRVIWSANATVQLLKMIS